MIMRRKAFTLVELLVVIAIIAILMGILLPSLARVRESAKRSVCSARMRQTGIALVAYAADYSGRLPTYGYIGHPYAVYRNDRADSIDSKGNPLPLKVAALYARRYVSDARIFYCPSNQGLLYKYESYVNPPPWGTLPQIYNSGKLDGTTHNQWVRMGYTYLPLATNFPQNANGEPTAAAERIDLLDRALPYMTDVIRTSKNELSHVRGKSYALNAMYKDGHVGLCNDQTVFGDGVWQRMEYGVITELAMYPVVFKLISGQIIPTVQP
jgi:prepilin-type N-terminal cleavage/methylation domain-containing protein